jgi:hypothetical protein
LSTSSPVKRFESSYSPELKGSIQYHEAKVKKTVSIPKFDEPLPLLPRKQTIPVDDDENLMKKHF